MPLLPRLLLWIAGLCYVGFGIACLIAPLPTLAAAGVVFSGEPAAAEVRAFYGGLELGLGALLIAAAQSAEYLRAGLWLCLASYGGIGLARLLGMAIDGVATPFLVAAAATELVLAATAGWALLRPRTGENGAFAG